MLWTLVKKQFIELFRSYFVDRKTGKARSAPKIAMLFVLFFAVLVYVGIMFYNMCKAFAVQLRAAEMPELYFALTGIFAAFLGIFGSVFNTYSGLYKSKDNDLLLSMPIKPGIILASRMVGVYVLGLIYEAVVMIPAIISWARTGPVSGKEIAFSALVIILLALVVLALTCLLGWVVAIISSKFRKNTAVTVILTLALMGGYYFLWGNFNRILTLVTEKAPQMNEAIRTKVFPFYAMGKAASGSTVYLLIFAAIAVAAALITTAVLASTFIKLATASKGAKKRVYKEKKARVRSTSSALLRKELARFTGSTLYMMNCGLNVIMFIAAAVVLLIKRAALLEVLAANEAVRSFMPAGIVAGACLVNSIGCISAPSVSLEGKSIWIVQSAPVAAYDVLRAKAGLHIVIEILPTVIFTLSAAICLGVSPAVAAAMCATSVIYLISLAQAGVVFNLLSPSLEWTNEVVPIKQGMPVIFTMLFGVVSAAVAGAGYFALGTIAGMTVYLIVIAAVFTAVALILRRWLKTKGSRIFEEL